MTLQLERPLVFFDLETTGTDIATSRIVEIAVLRTEPSGAERQWHTRINPLVPIPEEASAIHGIRDGDVADSPTLAQVGDDLLALFAGADIAGYNAMRFDVPLLVEECYRHGIAFDVASHRLVDAYRIFQIMEPHTLTAAYRKYCGKELVGAHSALADVLATRDVLLAQVERYESLPRQVEALATLCQGERKSADTAGRLGYDAQGRIVFNFGKHKGRRVEEIFAQTPSYYDWIMGNDFPNSTKEVLRGIMASLRKR